MANSVSLCGSPTKAGGTCRNRVEQPGLRCPLHERRLDPDRVYALCIKVTNAVLKACAVYGALEKLYPHVAPYVHTLHGLLMPEHFWLEFDNRDVKQMRIEHERAKTESALVIRGRYEGYSAKEQERVVAAYEEILEVLQRERVTA